MDKIVTKFMGETSAKLRQIFDTLAEINGVYLFDEFDAIGGERALDTDVGEMRRVLNSFLQFIDRDQSSSLIVAATNNPRLLDQALFRRFDDVLQYGLPGLEHIERLIANRLGAFLFDSIFISEVSKEALGLSHAEIAAACDDAVKEAILNDENHVVEAIVRAMLLERQAAYGRGFKE
jgi:SpoVK/Ycf46/Vps4 family AAA+-type ATPase